nr:hypothetical protein [Candidatus Hakubella thermalkaliphila]
MLHLIADPPGAKLAQVGKIFSQLGRLDSHKFGQLMRGNDLPVPIFNFLKTP